MTVSMAYTVPSLAPYWLITLALAALELTLYPLTESWLPPALSTVWAPEEIMTFLPGTMCLRRISVRAEASPIRPVRVSLGILAMASLVGAKIVRCP